jgi:hypothetical protein
MPDEPGRLAGLFGARRTLERGREIAVRDRDMVEPDLPGDESPEASLPDPGIVMAPALPAADRAVVLDLGVVRGLSELDRVLDRVVDRVAGRRGGVTAIGFADCIVLAAVMSALAAVVIALVAVFIDCIADDIVLAEAVAFVAAAVIFVAAEVTLVAADDTPLAAVAGVAVLRLDVLRRAVLVLRAVPVRLAGLRLPEVVLRRAVVARDAVGRDAVDRDAVLRVDREAVLRVVERDAVLRAGLAAVLWLADGIEDDDLEPDMDEDRLAVPRDALRVTGLLRAELAGLRRVAARVVD